MRIEDLTPEQVEQFQACKTYEEFTAFADEAGVEFDESQAEALRLIFNDPEAFAARMGQASAEAEDEDIAVDKLKSVAGGADQSAYVPAIQALVDPVRWRKLAMQYSNYYNWL